MGQSISEMDKISLFCVVFRPAGTLGEAKGIEPASDVEMMEGKEIGVINPRIWRVDARIRGEIL